MKIESRRLKNVIIDTYERREGGAVLHLIAHNTLVPIMLHHIPKEMGFSYDTEVFMLEPGHYMAKCTFEDKFIKVVEFGEVLPDTLESQISKNFPATIAANRAFDRAAIKYLDLPYLVYSDQEIMAMDKKANVPDYTYTETMTFEENVNKVMSGSGNNNEVLNESRQESRNPVPTNDDFQEIDSLQDGEPAAQKKNEPPKKEVREKDRIGFTEYADLTIPELFEKDKKKLIWIAKRVKTGPNLAVADAARKYLDERNIKYA